MVDFGKSDCIPAEVVVLGQKWLYSDKSGCIRAKWLNSGKSRCIGAKVVVFGKVTVNGQSVCIRAK